MLLTTLAWSFVGILVKTASGMADSMLITFARFGFGVLFLGGLLLARDGRIRLAAALPWVWIGAAGKSLNYLFENIALKLGYSYSNILVPPIQTIVLLLASALWLKEQPGTKGWTAAACCISGVLMIGWNGETGDFFGGTAGLTTLMFALAGIGAAVHVLSQRALVRHMDSGTMNFTVFFWASLMTAAPLPLAGDPLPGGFSAAAWGAMIGLGLITGLSFFWFAEALKRVSFPVVVIVSNSSVLFQLVWSFALFGEPITGWIVAGALIFITGIVLLNLPAGRVVRGAEGEKDAAEPDGRAAETDGRHRGVCT